jgi:hypothetical protein
MLGREGVIDDASDESLAVGRIDAAIARRDDLLVVFEVKVGSGQLGRTRRVGGGTRSCALSAHARVEREGEGGASRTEAWPLV